MRQIKALHLALAVVAFVALCAVLRSVHNERRLIVTGFARVLGNEQSISFENAVRAIYAPFLVPISARSFMDRTAGEVYTIPDEPIWTAGLGKKLCIVDIDTRPLNDTNQILNNNFNWTSLEGISPGMLNHYLYATIHGYDYKFVHTTEYINHSRSGVWTKVSALADILRSYDIVVSVDADAIFRHLHLPYEWLMNRWNITLDTSVAMPLDPNWDINTDTQLGYTLNKFGVLNPNAGFVTAQNLPRTFEILRAWDSCPDNESRYPGCSRFRENWPAEQGAFGEYVRYEFNRDTDFKAFNCTDGNGFPGQGSECLGLFVRHFTTGKDKLKSGVGDALLSTFMGLAQEDMMRKKEEFVIQRDTNEIHTE